jgi:flavin reductase (DIM6/NTAB) family NADH-FMN oxidoreductase RutF
MQLNQQEIQGLDKEFRRAFINSLAGFRQAVLVGTQSAAGKTNLAIFNSLIHLGANPALFGLINRPDSVQRDTLQNIESQGVYTLNYVAGADYQKAHQTSARYPQGVSEFEKVGFEEQYRPSLAAPFEPQITDSLEAPLKTQLTPPFPAPFVAGAMVQIGMKLEERVDLKINGTVLLIGSIQSVYIDDALVAADGFVNLSEAGVLVSQGLDAYFTTSPLGRLPYAKP